MGINIPTKEELIANKPEFQDIANYLGKKYIYISITNDECLSCLTVMGLQCFLFTINAPLLGVSPTNGICYVHDKTR